MLHQRYNFIEIYAAYINTIINDNLLSHLVYRKMYGTFRYMQYHQVYEDFIVISVMPTMFLIKINNIIDMKIHIIG